MSTCKYCNAEISWIKIDNKNVPMNSDNTQHRCKTESKPTESSKTSQGVTLECRIANLKAFIDLMIASGIDKECWPACAGVYNATR